MSWFKNEINKIKLNTIKAGDLFETYGYTVKILGFCKTYQKNEVFRGMMGNHIKEFLTKVNKALLTNEICKDNVGLDDCAVILIKQNNTVHILKTTELFTTIEEVL